MLTFDAFSGINNVIPQNRLDGADLVTATDVDIGLTGEVSRRAGFSLVDAQCHKNLWQASGFMLATVEGKLTAIHPDGTRQIIHPALGSQRVWYCNLPDGRTTFSNGLIQGITDGRQGQDRNVPMPAALGAPEATFGSLHRGFYRYYLTHVRLADRLESPAASSAPFEVTQGGIRIDGVPQIDGHATNVYLSGPDGEEAYMAGTATSGTFEYTSGNNQLTLLSRTLGAQPFPLGTITAFWRGRVLVAQGSTLWASRPNALHLSEWRDFRPFPAPITAIQPVDGGIYVGTTEDLVWLGGETFDSLTYSPTARGPVVLGSGVSAPGNKIKVGDGAGDKLAMLCIAGGEVVAGFPGGQTTSLTKNRYRKAPAEVWATFRELGGVPQYVAVPR